MRVSTSLVLVIGAMLGCYRDVAGPSAVGSATVRLTVVGVPDNTVHRVEVYVTEVAASTEPDSVAGAAEWAVIARPRVTIDLLDLQGGLTVLLGEGLLPTGRYRTLRLSIDGDSSDVRLPDGSVAKVRWPAPGVFSFQVPADEPIQVGSDGTGIVIELDVGQSFSNLIADPLHDLLFAPVARAAGTAVSAADAGAPAVRNPTPTVPVAPVPLGAVSLEVS